MELGLHLSDYSWNLDPHEVGATFAETAKQAEDAGFSRVTVMDHFWQIPVIGPAEHEMLEAYTALGFLAGNTSRVLLHTLVTGVIYREPGLLAKAVTTLDVLSGGRALLGIGAAWNADESAGLGFAFPPVAERFDRLEEAIQIVLQMWSDSEKPYEGKHYRLARTLNSPQPVSAPRPRLMIGGSGERRTLRLVARYADECNIAGGPRAEHKLDVLRDHCEHEGREYESIVKTTTTPFDLGRNGEGADELLERLQRLHALGFTVAYGSLRGPDGPQRVEAFGRHVLPVVSQW